MTLPVDYANATVSLDTHPDAHNATNAAVNALDSTVTALDGTVAALDTRVDTLESVDAFTMLTGSGAPASSLGAVGNYYLDSTNRILYGPKGSSGADQTVTVTGTPNTTNGFEWGVKTLFGIAGTVTRCRYYRDTGHSATITVRAWNVYTNAKITEIADTRAGQTGWFEVTFPTPVVIAANSTVLFSYGAAVVGYHNVSATYTASANCSNVGRFYSTTLNAIPDTNSAGLGVFIEPIFGAGEIWPIAVGGIVTFLEQSVTPTNPTANDRILTYCINNKIVFAFNNAGTMRYKSLAMDAAGVTWVDHGSTAP